MHARKLSTIVLLTATVFLAAAGPAQQTPTWSIDFDDPPKDGTQTTTVELSYIDALGKKQKKSISVTTEIEGSDGSADKMAAVKSALDGAIAESENQPGGDPLLQTGGVGDVLSITTAAQTEENGVANLKIESVETDDDKTNEKDKVNDPEDEAPSLGVIWVRGSITGLEVDDTPSSLGVATALGSFSVALSGSMEMDGLVEEIGDGLEAQGATVWVDLRLDRVMVLIDDDVDELGAGSSDRGLAVSCLVRVPR